jgi:L-2-hydroxyglutarate oxidase LhgO
VLRAEHRMTTPLELDAVVIGGGVIGLAVARALALSGREVTLLEAESSLGSHSSSRNSEVIHAGIYYAPGSLKARACLLGRHAMYDYCARQGVAHERLGKIIVATREEEIQTLERLKLQAEFGSIARKFRPTNRWFRGCAACSLRPRVSSTATNSWFRFGGTPKVEARKSWSPVRC